MKVSHYIWKAKSVIEFHFEQEGMDFYMVAFYVLFHVMTSCLLSSSLVTAQISQLWVTHWIGCISVNAILVISFKKGVKLPYYGDNSILVVASFLLWVIVLHHMLLMAEELLSIGKTIDTVNREIFVIWNFCWKNFHVEKFS